MLVPIGEFRRKSIRTLRRRPVLFALVAAFPATAHSQADTAVVPAPSTQPAPPPSLPPSKPTAEPLNEPAIVITGSRIPRPNLTAVSPVAMVTNQDVKLEGATNIEDVLNQLPQVNPSQGQFVSNGATGTATIDLRGLGAARTLVLINGRRLMPGDPGDPVPDINIVPTSLIKRVDVLTGGAAAVYGSDAVAGVVNFILDTDLNGLRVDGEMSVFQHDNRNSADQQILNDRGIVFPHGNVVDGHREYIDVAYGRSFWDDRGHITVYGGYRQIAALRQDRRDYSACTLTVARDPTVVQCGGSVFSFPANFFDNLNNVYQLGPDRTFVPGINFYNFGPWNFWQRPDKRYTAGGFANVDFSNAVKAYAEVMYMNDRSLAQIAPTADFANTQTINCDNPLLSQQQLSLICREGNFVGETAELDDEGNVVQIDGTPTQFTDPVTGNTYEEGFLAVARRNVEGGPRQADLRHKNIRLVGGVTGDLADGITYDASFQYGRVTASATSLNDFSVTRLTRSLDVISDPVTGQPVCRSVLTGEDPACVPWDIFQENGVSQAALTYLDVPSSIDGSYKQWIGTAYANVNVGRWGIASPWADEDPIINFGGDVRKDTLDYEPDLLAQSADLAGDSVQFLPVRGSIEAKELFGEVRIPLINDHLIRRLSFEGGFRHSWYTNGDNKFGASAYKLALDLTVVTGLRFRASQQRAVRAPNLQELFSAPEADFFDRDPCAGVNPTATLEQCESSGVTPAQYGHIVKLGTAFAGYNAVDGGNPALLPETATTRTLGIVLQPRMLRGFNATVDWWAIDLDGAIAGIGPQTILDTCVASGDPFFCSRVHRDPNGSLWQGGGFVDNRQGNLGGYKLRGVDTELNYTHTVGRLGSLSANVRGSYVDKWIVDLGGLSEPFDCAGLYGAPCGSPQPRWRHTARLTWASKVGTTVSLQWRYTGGMKIAALDPKFGIDQFVSPLETHLAPFSYFDLTTAFDVSKRYELRLGVSNILDRQPPRVLNNTPGGDGPLNGNTYPQWYDPLGRFIFAAFTVNVDKL